MAGYTILMKTKLKVIAYIIRKRTSGTEVLVFDHRRYPDAGTQVIGGTIELGEDFVDALIREIKEESGIEITRNDFIKKLGETQYKRSDVAEINIRHYYLIIKDNLPDQWSHTVVSNGSDNGLQFDFYWQELNYAMKTLTGNFGELLSLI